MYSSPSLKTEIQFAWASSFAEIKTPVYMRHSYQALLADHDGSAPRLLRCTLAGQEAYLPILVRDIGNGRKEAYSAYGYGGLLGELRLSDTDVDSLRHFLWNESIIAVFLRHSPFLANQQQWPSGLTEFNRRTYAATLRTSASVDDYAKGIPQKLRWSVNYARRAGLHVSFLPLSKCPPEHIQAFYELYAELMRQKQTADYYLFSESFFIEHSLALGSDCELAEITHPETGKLLAAAFFLLDETGWVHYHLSAASLDAMKLQGMEFLMISALQRYGNLGHKTLHLGGGHALDESDGLSRFKAKFADLKLDFCYSKLVCNEAAYHAERARIPLKNPKFFLLSDARDRKTLKTSAS